MFANAEKALLVTSAKKSAKPCTMGFGCRVAVVSRG